MFRIAGGSWQKSLVCIPLGGLFLGAALSRKEAYFQIALGLVFHNRPGEDFVQIVKTYGVDMHWRKNPDSAEIYCLSL